MNNQSNTNCHNCGSCCGLVQCTPSECFAIEAYMRDNNITPIYDNEKDGTCPFRDSKKHKCLIYPVRPKICQIFGMGNDQMLQCRFGNTVEMPENIKREMFHYKRQQLVLLNAVVNDRTPFAIAVNKRYYDDDFSNQELKQWIDKTLCQLMTIVSRLKSMI